MNKSDLTTIPLAGLLLMASPAVQTLHSQTTAKKAVPNDWCLLSKVQQALADPAYKGAPIGVLSPNRRKFREASFRSFRA